MKAVSPTCNVDALTAHNYVELSPALTLAPTALPLAPVSLTMGLVTGGPAPALA